MNLKNDRKIISILNEKILNVEEFKTELTRKSIHISFFVIVPISKILGHAETILLISSFLILYLGLEILRIKNKCSDIGLIKTMHRITLSSSRKRDDINKIITGPVTLMIGMILALLLPSPYSDIGIYCLVFGDGFASLIGKTFGRIKITLINDKTIEGSFACFMAVFISSMLLFDNLQMALALGGVIAILEYLSIKDIDNLFIPITAGAFVYAKDFFEIMNSLYIL